MRWVTRELTGRPADYVEIYELEERRKKPRSIDEDFINDVKKNTIAAADALRKGDFSPKPSNSRCKSCDYVGLCTSGQRAMSPNA